MARRSFYRFPEDLNISKEILVAYGMTVRVSYEDYEDEWLVPTDLNWFDRLHKAGGYISEIDRTISTNVSTAKKLIKKYGGEGFTEHYDRDGGLFETSVITVKGNNSTFKYNRHL